ncbi:hypothetical protein OSB04_un001807, partial [Centaurea solstitialis]
MSKEIIGIGSESRPPVLVMGEYQQWKRRMIHFLDLLDENLIKSIREGPIRPTVTVVAVPRTDNCPELSAYVVEKPIDMYNPEQRARHLIDKRALTLLIMALPNDMYARVDSLTNARDVWLEIEQQMQGGDTALESQKESALNAYEGFKARDNESLTESYQRLNAFVNDLRRLGVEKTKYEVNVKFLKNLTPEWQNLAINIQLSRNLGHDGPARGIYHRGKSQEDFKARDNESLTESYQRLNAFVNDLRRLGVEKTKYEVNVKFLKNLTPEWQNLAINIQLSRNLGVMGLHDLFSMMVQHEEFITGGRAKKAVDPLALAAVPFGGPNSVPIQPSQYNSPQYHQEDFYQEFNPNLGSSVQHPDDPLIITISDEELYNVNESLALISHNVQKLNANRGFNRSRGSGFPSGGRMMQGRGGHYQPDRAQYGNQGRGSYQQGEMMQSYDQGSYCNNQGRYREDQGRYREDHGRYREEQGRFRDQSRRDNTYLDYQGGQGYQGDWRGQVSDINYQRSLKHYTPESGYIDRHGYEGGYGGRYESGRIDQGPGYGFEQNRNDNRADERMDRGKGSFNGGDSRGNSSRQAQREDQQVQADQGVQRSNHPQ